VYICHIVVEVLEILDNYNQYSSNHLRKSELVLGFDITLYSIPEVII
jgi:hypothetical protein